MGTELLRCLQCGRRVDRLAVRCFCGAQLQVGAPPRPERVLPILLPVAFFSIALALGLAAMVTLRPFANSDSGLTASSESLEPPLKAAEVVETEPSPVTVPAVVMSAPETTQGPPAPAVAFYMACRDSIKRAPSRPTTETQASKIGKVTLASSIERKTYVAQGCTDRQLRDSAVQNMPRKPTENTIGLTQWGTAIDYTFTRGTSNCVMADATITLTIIVHIPEAATREGVPPLELTKWDAEVARIRAHEERHVEIDTRGARRLQDALQQIRPATRCSDVEISIKNVANKITAEVQQENRAFDVEDKQSHLQ